MINLCRLYMRSPKELMYLAFKCLVPQCIHIFQLSIHHLKRGRLHTRLVSLSICFLPERLYMCMSLLDVCAIKDSLKLGKLRLKITNFENTAETYNIINDNIWTILSDIDKNAFQNKFEIFGESCGPSFCYTSLSIVCSILVKRDLFITNTLIE